jgi:NAD(P)-dependent dehydrogenase (short-subunit alcohol dehydrogenase family)
MAHALGKANINVNAVAPGFTATEASLDMSSGGGSNFGNATMGQSIQRREEPRDLVGATLFLASPDSDFISGQVIYVDGGTVML